jgi:hypothetical protein
MSKKQKRIFWPGTVILGLSAIVLATASTRLGNSSTHGPKDLAPRNALLAVPLETETSPAPQGTPVRGAAQMVRFTVYDAGIFPSEARVRAGVVAIYVEDVSGSSTGLVVQRDSQPTGF